MPLTVSTADLTGLRVNARVNAVIRVCPTARAALADEPAIDVALCCFSDAMHAICQQALTAA